MIWRQAPRGVHWGPRLWRYGSWDILSMTPFDQELDREQTIRKRSCSIKVPLLYSESVFFSTSRDVVSYSLWILQKQSKNPACSQWKASKKDAQTFHAFDSDLADLQNCHVGPIPSYLTDSFIYNCFFELVTHVRNQRSLLKLMVFAHSGWILEPTQAEMRKNWCVSLRWDQIRSKPSCKDKQHKHVLNLCVKYSRAHLRNLKRNCPPPKRECSFTPSTHTSAYSSSAEEMFPKANVSELPLFLHRLFVGSRL